MIKITKTIVLGLTAAFLLTACSNDQEQLNTPTHAVIAADATKAEIQHEKEYIEHAKAKKKRKKRNSVNKQKIDLKKFCFKDNTSIHYKSNERCK